MAVICTGADRVITVSVTGEVDHHRAKDIMRELGRFIDGALPRCLTLDLEGVTFMDSSGIAVLLRARRRMEELGGTMRVAHVPEQAGRVLRAAGIDRLISFEDT